MNNSTRRTLTMLRLRGSKGVSMRDEFVPRGFALKSRICDLRKMNYVIIGRAYHGRLFRYFLMSEPPKKEKQK